MERDIVRTMGKVEERIIGKYYKWSDEITHENDLNKISN